MIMKSMALVWYSEVQISLARSMSACVRASAGMSTSMHSSDFVSKTHPLVTENNRIAVKSRLNFSSMSAAID